MSDSKTTKATHYEWIDGMSAEFVEAIERGEIAGSEIWHLRILLSIAQQLSVIAAHLKNSN
jgi:hypothetical protein